MLYILFLIYSKSFLTREKFNENIYSSYILYIYNTNFPFIRRGQWHGEVLVYFYNNLTEKKIPKFLQELRRLSRIRHEYIHLFMGASVNTSDIAIVMRLKHEYF